MKGLTLTLTRTVTRHMAYKSSLRPPHASPGAAFDFRLKFFDVAAEEFSGNIHWEGMIISAKMLSG